MINNIISCEVIQKEEYNVTILKDNNPISLHLVKGEIYTIDYLLDGVRSTSTGRLINVVGASLTDSTERLDFIFDFSTLYNINIRRINIIYNIIPFTE